MTADPRFFTRTFRARLLRLTDPVLYPAGSRCPGTPNPSGTPEAFMDTAVVNGKAYPYLPVGREPYRFRILNARQRPH